MHEVLFAQRVAKHELGPETSLEISSTFGWYLSHLYNDAHQKLEQRMAIVGCITEEASRALDLSLCKDDLASTLRSTRLSAYLYALHSEDPRPHLLRVS